MSFNVKNVDVNQVLSELSNLGSDLQVVLNAANTGGNPKVTVTNSSVLLDGSVMAKGVNRPIVLNVAGLTSSGNISVGDDSKQNALNICDALGLEASGQTAVVRLVLESKQSAEALNIQNADSTTDYVYFSGDVSTAVLSVASSVPTSGDILVSVTAGADMNNDRTAVLSVVRPGAV